MNPFRLIAIPAMAAAATLAASCGGGESDDTRYTTDFADDAFPPVMPNDEVHGGSHESWEKESCLNCHAKGINGAPKIRHEGMSEVLLDAKCRTCHTSAQ